MIDASCSVPNIAMSTNPKTNQNPIQNTVKNNPTTPSREANRKKKTFKIIVIGDTGVGKTCLTYRFCSGKFPSTPTDATIGVDFREKLITLDNNEQVQSLKLSFMFQFLTADYVFAVLEFFWLDQFSKTLQKYRPGKLCILSTIPVYFSWLSKLERATAKSQIFDIW